MMRQNIFNGFHEKGIRELTGHAIWSFNPYLMTRRSFLQSSSTFLYEEKIFLSKGGIHTFFC